jgi:hypothetical protein
MKRIIAAVTAAASVISLAGCGSSSSPASTVKTFAVDLANGDGAKACTTLTNAEQQKFTSSLLKSCPLAMSLAAHTLTEKQINKIKNGAVQGKTTIHGKTAVLQTKNGDKIELVKRHGAWLISGGIS